MEFVFRYSKQTEIDRLIFTYGSIVKGLYQKLGFLLAEHKYSNYKDNTVIIPVHRPILSEKVIKILQDEDLCAGVFTSIDELQNVFRKEFDEIELLKEIDVERMKTHWNEIQTKTKEVVEILFPDHGFKKVEIIPTNYGTIGSYHAENNIIYLNIRIDQSVTYIVTILIRAIVHYTGLEIKTEDETYLNQSQIWKKKEEFTDMLMRNSALKFLCPHYKSTLELLENPELDESLVIESNNLYAKLGFPVTKALKLNGLVVKLYDKKLEGLTETQNKLVVNLLKKEEQIVSNEEIAEIMWGKDYFNKYSLSAMAKMIHQLREKLKSSGLQKEVIFTKRGKGYVLVQ